MKNRFSFILATLIFFITACSDSEEKKLPATSQETQVEEKPEKVQENKTEITQAIVLPKPIEEYSYNFQNLKKQNNALHIINDVYNFKNIKQPIVIVTIMSTWCPPCRGQIPHLSKLQQKFKENVFVMGTLVHDDMSKEELEKFVIAQKMFFYLSTTQKENLRFVNMITPKLGLTEEFPMPLTLVFVKGRYFT